MSNQEEAIQEKKINWTDEQKDAIFDRDKNLLVSASAGSGKTTVMIQRIITLMLEKEIPISNFLVVTFTKASASDMKKKLIDELLKKQDNAFALKQIEDVEISDISNLHSFCSRLISTYFYEVGIDPAYHIVDETESSFLKERALTKLFEQKEKNGDESFFELFEIFQKKRSDKALKEVIKRFNNFLNSNIDGKAWFETTLESSHDINLETNVCAKLINTYVSKAIEKDAEKTDKFASKCLEFGQEKLYEHFVDISSKLRSVRKQNSFLTNAKNVYEIKFERTPSVAKDFKFLGEEAKVIKDAIKDNVNNYKNNYVSNDEMIIFEGLKNSKSKLIDLFDLVCEFNEIYSALKKEVNGLDFNDLERFALKILSNESILESVRKKYAYVFVDEYQDINNVQEKIISLVSGKDNRFMVGDVKQSIYRFRLCDPDIFLEKYDEYGKNTKHNKLIKLNCNFRSDKNILKFVDQVFSGVMTEDFGGVDYKNDAQFVAGEKNLDNKDSVNLCFIDTTIDKKEKVVQTGVYSVKNHVQEDDEEVLSAVAEGKFVANKIAELVSPKNPNRIGYSDVAILVGSRNEAVSKFIETLESFNIPVSSDEKHDLMEKNYILEIIDFVKIVCNDKDDFVLFRVLKSKLFNFSDEDLVEIRKLNLATRFFENIGLYENLENVELREKIQDFNAKLSKYKVLAKIVGVKDFVKAVVEDFCLNKINLTETDGENINEQIDTFVSALPNVDVFEFVLNYKNFSLEFENECGGDAVKLMTIHKSKGIEFKAVFVINTANGFNFKSTFGNILFNKYYGAGMNYFDFISRNELSTIPISAIKMLEKRKLVEEQQRVLYVALTRSIEKLFVVCSKKKEKLNAEFSERPTSYANWFEPFIVRELEGKHNELINFETYEIKDLLDVPKLDKKQLIFNEEKAIEPEWFDYEYKDCVGVSLKNSVSKILKCNDETDDDYETKLVYERGDFSAAERGTIYHKLFQNINLKNLQNIDEQIQIIRGLFDENEWNLIDEKVVKNVLKLSFFEKIEQNDVILQEREFYANMPAQLINKITNSDDSFIMQGVVDLIVVKDNEIWILDYKTGQIDEKKLENYKFQLDTYANVCERAFGKKVTNKFLCMIDLQKILEI